MHAPRKTPPRPHPRTSALAKGQRSPAGSLLFSQECRCRQFRASNYNAIAGRLATANFLSFWRMRRCQTQPTEVPHLLRVQRWGQPSCTYHHSDSFTSAIHYSHRQSTIHIGNPLFTSTIDCSNRLFKSTVHIDN